MTTKFEIKKIWEKRYGNETEVIDYAGRKMIKSACSNPNSLYQPTIDHIRPLSKDGKDVEGNIEICNRNTNLEKADNFPHFKANGKKFKVLKAKGKKDSYKIVENNK